MAFLFTLPKVISLPGARLYFFQTNTATPQAVYTDADLTVAHEIPVEASGAGVFPPIYLDPTLPDYRVTLNTSADVLIYTVDDVPSNQNVQQSMRLESTSPSLLLYDTDGPANVRKINLRVSGNTFVCELLNDAENSALEIFSCTAGVISLPLTATMGGYSIAAIEAQGTFTGTYTGFTTSPTESVVYSRVADMVTLYFSGTSATSNDTSMTITGMPAVLIPGITRSGMLCRVTDNGGAASIGTISVSTGGVITFGLGAAGGVFTNTGTKSTLPSTITYKRTN